MAPGPSPPKTFVMDTGAVGDASPWRIKVTVEAEPQEGSSPSKSKIRTMTVPLKGGSSSPAKSSRQTRKTVPSSASEGMEVRRPQGKRKGTPLRPRRKSPRLDEVEDAMTSGRAVATQEDDDDNEVATDAMVRRTKPTTRERQPTARYKRLSQARLDLDHALQDAIGTDSVNKPGQSTVIDPSGMVDEDSESGADGPGDVTVANEDFTMISVESLQSMKENTSRLNDSIGDVGHNSAMSESYMPSSPPIHQEADHVKYPDLSRLASGTRPEARSEQGDHAMEYAEAYDVMSWKPTGRAASVKHLEATEVAQAADRPRPNHTETHPPREPVRSSPQNMIEDREAEVDAGDDRRAESNGDDDIWAEEASRSLEEDQGQLQPPRPSSNLAELFSDQQLKPPRPKIPRTWRRSSGNDFSYVDSPEYGALKSGARKSSGASTDGEGGQSRSSGVLTPPSTDDEIGRRVGHEQIEEDISLTQADAAATQLEVDTDSTSAAARQTQHFRVSRQEDSFVMKASANESDMLVDPVISRPSRRQFSRPQRRAPMDLSELLNLGSKSSSQEPIVAPVIQADSKKRGSEVRNSRMEVSENEVADTSDQRQLLAEMKEAITSSKDENNAELAFALGSLSNPRLNSESASGAFADDLGGHSEINGSWSENVGEEDEANPSYEEHLNIESPQKIKVKFNDSHSRSDLLQPRRTYPNLFTGEAAAPPDRRRLSTVQKPEASATVQSVQAAQPGIFSRLSATIFSAVLRPTGPAEIVPQPLDKPEYPRSLRTSIRSRYGVLSESHPWTMAHMRTLHRLLNSCTSGKSDSVVPKSGPLPSTLLKFVDKKLRGITEFHWIFTEQHAHVVDAFMQTLVPAHVDEAIRSGEMDFLGDSQAKRHRGLLAGRHGDLVVFEGETGVVEPKGRIQVEWVVKALGNCVMANIDTTRRAAVARNNMEI